MNVNKWITLSVAPLVLNSCVPFHCGDTSFEAKDEQYDILAEEIFSILEENEYDSIDDITCEELCSSVVFGHQAHFTTTSCTQDIDTDYFANLDATNDSGMSDTGNTQDTTVVGTVTCSGDGAYYCEGRRPLGLEEKTDETIGYFAQSAYLEAVSVIAFAQLSKQLKEWNAPKEYIDRCLSALKDEIAHAQIMSKLAEQRNEPIPRITFKNHKHTLLEEAIHNASEGCIFETWAALEAMLKAKLAATEPLREVYSKIAEDEIRHAQLSWDLHTWFMSQLSNEHQEQVKAEQLKSLELLKQEAKMRIKRFPKVLGLHTINCEQLIEQFSAQVA